jgi:arylsulfatase A-like enzyme
MRFTNAYAAAPLCSPTRASVMTGKYPARLHVTQVIGHQYEHKPKNPKWLSAEFEDQLALEEVTIAEALKPGGYTSGIIGKWHLGTAPYYPEKQGFDVNVAGTESGMPRSYFHPAWLKNVPIQGREGEYLTDRLTEEAERFIEANKDRPFLLDLSHFAVHIPLEAKPQVIARYQAKAKPTEGQNHPVYAAMVESMDESVGRILDQLDRLKLADRTVVVFTSDNGGLTRPDGKWPRPTSNSPLRSGKGHLYEGGIREPLIVRWPGVTRPGTTCDVPVSSIDFYPTILDIAGIRDQPGHHSDGLSFVPLLKGAGGLKRRELYWHFPHYSNQKSRPSGAVRQGDFKLIEYYKDGSLELFNLREDLGETRNLADTMPAKARELRKKLRDWRGGVKAWMPRPNPAYDPAKPDQSP